MVTRMRQKMPSHLRDAWIPPASAISKQTSGTIRRSSPHPQNSAALAPEAAALVGNTIQGPGIPLPAELRRTYEPSFHFDFSQVRIFSGPEATASSQALGAQAYTVGNHIVLGEHPWKPETPEGRRLLTHELTHVVQNQGTSPALQTYTLGDSNSAAEREAHAVSSALERSTSTPPISHVSPSVIRRQEVAVRSPFVEEALTLYSTISGAIGGRYLTGPEIALARSVFGDSLDYYRIQFIPSEGRGVDWRVVGNTIREPKGFTIKDAFMAKTFIHELTHVWQYQHFGTSYISHSLYSNAVAYLKYRDRNKAYAYTVEPNKSFFAYKVEQQASIVEDYFIAQRDIANPKTTPERKAEAQTTVNQLKGLIAQMRTALPLPERRVMELRALDVMTETKPGGVPLDIPREQQMVPLKPILTVEF